LAVRGTSMVRSDAKSKGALGESASRIGIQPVGSDTSDAAFALTEIRPTAIAGVIALPEYVEQFNSGLFWLESGT